MINTMKNTNKNFTGIIFVMISAILFLGGCASGTGNNTKDSNAAAIAKLDAMQNVIDGPKIIDYVDAPDFQLSDVYGRNVSKESLIGKPYILQAFASWCASCITESQRIMQAAENFTDKGLQVVHVSIYAEETNDTMFEFIRRANGSDDSFWTVDTSNVSLNYGFLSIESTVIIDRNGKMTYRDDSSSDVARIEQELRKVV